MNVNRILKIRDGDAINTLRGFLSRLWLEAGINSMQLPVELPDGRGLISKVITKREDLVKANPFAPIMASNSASIVGDFLAHHKGHLAVLLRPCEQRALVELKKRGRLDWATPGIEQADGWMLTMSIDCPGTLKGEDFFHQVSNQGIEGLTRQALMYKHSPGLKIDQLRTACRICDSICPKCADLTFGLMGEDAPTHYMIIARDETIDQVCHLDRLTDRVATEEEIVTVEEAMGKINDEHQAQRELLYEGDSGQFAEMCKLLAYFSCCTLCADCLDACPLYEGELAGLLGVKSAQYYERPILSDLVGLGRWLASCSGCGMCQEACENNVRLMLLISAMSHRIQQELHYVPGQPSQTLPWRPAHKSGPKRSRKEALNVVSR